MISGFMLPNTNKPLITVYITNFNYADYIENAINSVLHQSFKDFELIVIDDGSTDKSLEILETYKRNKNISLVYQKNKGLNKTNNVALRLGRGKYIMRLDADDYLVPDALEKMVGKMEANPEFALVFPDYYLIDEKNNVIGQVKRHNFTTGVTLFDLPAHGACTLIRRDVLLEIGGYDETFRCQDGYDLWLNIIVKFQVSNVNEPLFYYRQHAKSLTKNEENILRTRAKIKAKHYSRLNKEPAKVLTIIPVRGSELDPRSLPHSLLENKKLVDWTIDSSLSADTVNATMISTPDLALIEHVKEKYRSKVILEERGRGLARVNTGLEPSILNSVNKYCEQNEKPDLIAILFIEAPFRSSWYIDKAVYTQQLYNVDIVDGIREENEIMYYHNGHGLQPWKLESNLRLERESMYRRVGGLHLIRTDFLRDKQNMLSGKIGHITFDQKAAHVIRTELDWQIAQFLAKKEQ
jgi:glycosyltransferase involved in cell wall biosynthesis